MSQLTAEVVTVTPEWAQQVLDAQAELAKGSIWHQRALDKTRISQYANEMQAGTWKLNGEGIQFNGSRLLNGQHRLRAVIRAAVGVPMLIVRGVDESAFSTLDQGKSRSVGNLLQMQGVVYRAEVAGAARLAMLYEKTGTMARLLEERSSAHQVFDFAMVHQQELVDAAGWACACELGHRQALTTLAYLGRLRSERAQFFASLKDGVGLAASDPILRLRNYLVVDLARKRQELVGDVLATAMKAWNAHIRHEPVNRLVFKRNETYPTMIR